MRSAAALTSVCAALLALAASGATTPAAVTLPRITVYSSTGASSASGALDSFVQQMDPAAVRRIDWESVPDQLASPNEFPPDFFNVSEPMGVVFTTTGLGRFRVSARLENPEGTPLVFGDILPSYQSNFISYSPSRIFAPLDGNIMSVDFFVPGTTIPAMTRTFGLVFTDVDRARSTTVELFHGGTSLGVFAAPVPFGGGTSFVGVVCDTPVITRAVIASTGQLGAPDVSNGGGGDVVAMDDMIFEQLVEGATVDVRLGASRSGDDIVYTVTARNSGLGESSPLELEQKIPDGVAVLDRPAGSELADGVVRWSPGKLPGGASELFIVRARPSRPGLYGSSVSLGCANDTDWRDNEAEVVAVPSACPVALTYDALGCRLEEMRAILATLPVPRGLASRLAARFAAAARSLQRAAQADAANRPHAVRSNLDAAVRSVASFRLRLGAKSATKALARPVRDELDLRAVVTSIDLRSLVP